LMAIDVIDELQLSSLQTSQELLMHKKDIIYQLDSRRYRQSRQLGRPHSRNGRNLG